MKNYGSIFFMLLFVLLLLSCSTEELSNTQEINSKEYGEDVLEILLEMGYSKKDIENFDDYYIVEGDIIFYKNRDYKIKERKSSEKQRRYLEGYVNMNEVKVYINNELNSDWRQAVSEAIDRYNLIDANLTLILTPNESEAHIEIKYDTSISGGLGTWPYADGRPGDFIYINPDTNVCSLNPDTRRGIIQHELGHNLGLHHTNSDAGSQFPNTPYRDDNSIMNSGGHPNVCSSFSIGFSTGDDTALRILFPFLDAFTVNIYGPAKGNNSSTYTWGTSIQDNTGPFAQEGGDAPFTYVWRKSNDRGVTYTSSWGNNTASYTANLPYEQDLYIKVIVTDANGITAYEEHVTLNEGFFKPSL